ncbi:hypothetical protein [Acetobacterium woodii]|uniref:Uncharacterized protein n=1 Tax=Acetobacterium woodii (strain ATCC 29683 / DSM 1030 / JCM 2381 / KCTC 1655 / WB1) TaxID=931626 RepID=H6LFR5_ACEWD|nr:hypothetical protein [Acetobacterium woodii]AFA47010.1 hypothetical protein Awo_c02010 [Acetobacterium woodii DSM 1030]
MQPINQYQFPPEKNESIFFRQGISLVVITILVFIAFIIGGLVFSYQKTADAANARLVYLAASAKAVEYKASGNYHTPVQADLIDLIGEEVNQDAHIEVFDDKQDAVIDYIVYIKNGLVTRYSPGELIVSKE